MRRAHLLCALLLAAGCPDRAAKKPASQKLRIGTIEVVDRTPRAMKVHVPEPTIARWIKDRLAKAPQIQLVGAGEGGKVYQLRIQVALARRRPDFGKKRSELVAIVAARAQIPTELTGIVLQASTVAPLEAEKPSGALQRKHLKRTLEAVLADLSHQGALAVADAARFVEELRTKDLQRLMAAIGMAGSRRIKPAVPRLIELLKHKDDRISDRAVGALVAIGDRRAVKPLTRLAPFSDTERMAKVIDGIAALGGPEAISYLEFVGTGHPDADIRNLAREALARTKRKPR